MAYVRRPAIKMIPMTGTMTPYDLGITRSNSVKRVILEPGLLKKQLQPYTIKRVIHKPGLLKKTTLYNYFTHVILYHKKNAITAILQSINCMHWSCIMACS